VVILVATVAGEQYDIILFVGNKYKGESSETVGGGCVGNVIPPHWVALAFERDRTHVDIPVSDVIMDVAVYLN
jgi:hypothetical protein